LPTAVADPPNTFRTAPQSSNWTRQTDLSGAPADPSQLAQQYPSSGASASSDTLQRWTSEPHVAQNDPTRPSTPGQTSGLSRLGGQDAMGSSAGENGAYVVQPSDNYWSISQKVYGTGAYFKALAHHNRAKVPDPNRLGLGDEILTPDIAELETAYPDLCPKPAHREAAQRRALADGTHAPLRGGRVYVVQEGDNLFNIARYELGKATRWTEIVNLNQGLLGSNLNDLNYLTPGMKLVLPEDDPAANIGSRPDSRYQR
jgi:nucleoid-associated protein YgaU